MVKFDHRYWALIVGGSSGLGLATAQKLAAHGMNICIVHRDRKGAMSRIRQAFEGMQKSGVKVVTYNRDALSATERDGILTELGHELGEDGKIRIILHAVAFGNLKLLAPYHPKHPAPSLNENASKAIYNNHAFLDEEDFRRTLHAMGSNIVAWVQDLHQRTLFAEDARVVGLTSEGNRVAWRGYAAVSAAKAVLESVSRSMAVEFAPFGIRSNIVQAGVTDTAALNMIPGCEQIKAKSLARNPFGRLTLPEDVANVIFLLALDEAAWINGALICADGGERIG